MKSTPMRIPVPPGAASCPPDWLRETAAPSLGSLLHPLSSHGFTDGSGHVMDADIVSPLTVASTLWLCRHRQKGDHPLNRVNLFTAFMAVGETFFTKDARTNRQQHRQIRLIRHQLRRRSAGAPREMHEAFKPRRSMGRVGYWLTLEQCQNGSFVLDSPQ